MFIFSRRFHHRLVALTLILAGFLVACQGFGLSTNDFVATQDVGEEPPTLLSSPTPVPPAPTLPEAAATETLLVGPAPYPSPAAEMVPWERLVNQSLIADVRWETYQGELLGGDKGSGWTFSFAYPAGWYADPKASLVQAFVQNIPVTQGPLPAEFAKFEIVRLTDPPLIEEGDILNPKDLMTVKISGEPAILYAVTRQPDQMRQITALWQHGGGWLAAAGYINLAAADAATLDRYAAMMLHGLASFTFEEQSPEQPPAIPSATPAASKKPADSDYPAAGICAQSPGDFVWITIAPGNMPDPRCIQVGADQRLEFTNETGTTARIQLGQFDLTLAAGETQLFDLPVGDYLEPGVHHATVSAGSVPEIWLMPGVPISLEQPFAEAVLHEGPFDFDFYLYQDPGFSRNPSMTWMYSDIPGVGIRVSWIYHGPRLNDPVVESWGFCPDIGPRDTYPMLKEGNSSIREGGILLPRDAAPGLVVQFVHKVQTPQGTYGGVLSFQLLEGSQGVGPSNVTVYPLNLAGPTAGCISELQSSFMEWSQ